MRSLGQDADFVMAIGDDSSDEPMFQVCIVCNVYSVCIMCIVRGSCIYYVRGSLNCFCCNARGKVKVGT